MKKLIIFLLLCYNFNSFAEEYNVVCQSHASKFAFVIRDIESFDLAKQILRDLDEAKGSFFIDCVILKVKM